MRCARYVTRKQPSFQAPFGGHISLVLLRTKVIRQSSRLSDLHSECSAANSGEPVSWHHHQLLGSVHAEVLSCTYYMSTDFGDDSLRRFPFRARTNRQIDKETRLNALPHDGGYTAGMGNKWSKNFDKRRHRMSCRY